MIFSRSDDMSDSSNCPVFHTYVIDDRERDNCVIDFYFFAASHLYAY